VEGGQKNLGGGVLATQIAQKEDGPLPNQMEQKEDSRRIDGARLERVKEFPGGREGPSLGRDL